jgi:hypothetical protein
MASLIQALMRFRHGHDNFKMRRLRERPRLSLSKGKLWREIDAPSWPA